MMIIDILVLLGLFLGLAGVSLAYWASVSCHLGGLLGYQLSTERRGLVLDVILSLLVKCES